MSDKLKTYEGNGIRVNYDPSRCIHAAKCVAGLPAVFDAEKRPWIDPSQATAVEVAAAVRQCPTGALQFEASSELAAETPDEVNSISVAAAGPLFFRGDIRMIDTVTEEVVSVQTRMALCRCGKSKNKPFCDDSHFECEFNDPGMVGTGKLGETVDGPGELHVEPLSNGPLFITGPFVLSSADGSVVCRGNKTVLCRCGASENKPFCDGSHRDVGFEA